MGKLTKVTIFPSRYVQGPGAINEIGEHVKLLGDNVLVVGGKHGLAETREGRNCSFEANGIKQTETLFAGEVSDTEINRLTGILKKEGCNVVLAAGGGKTIDTVKVVAGEQGLPTVVVPSICSSDAPCSRLSVIYDDHGIFDRFYFPPRNPDLVVMDTEIIARSPARTLVAGLGDALATWFEADACNKAFSPNMSGALPSATAIALARLCYDILIEYGLQAKIAVEIKRVTPALEKVVEACTLLSGLGFESGGLGAAHSMQDGFTVLEPIHQYYHGEKVGFLTLIQLVMEERPRETLEEVYDFSAKVGLPMTLADLSIDKEPEEKLWEAVRLSTLPGKIMHNEPFPVTEQSVYDAMMVADAMGKRKKAGLPIC